MTTSTKATSSLTRRERLMRLAAGAGLVLGLLSVSVVPAYAQPASGETAATPAPDKKVEKNAAGEPVNAETKKVYAVTLRGKLGRDVSLTPFKALLADIRRENPDYVIFKVDFAANSLYGNVIAYQQVPEAISELDTCTQMATLFTEQLRSKDGGKKPKVVMWVRHAMGGAAFLPFAAEDIFYTSDAFHGAIGGLELGWQGFDQRVKEKMFGIFTSYVKGLAELGNHDSRLINPMMTYRSKLSIDEDGTLHEDYSGSYKILKEDPVEDEARRDTLEQVARNQGNDLLTLDAPTAKLIGLSRETVDSLDGILSYYDIERNYVLTEGRSKRIFENWGNEVRRAESDFLDLWAAFNDIQVEGNTPQERNQRRGAQIGVLNKIRGLLNKYKEAINPRAIQGAPEGWDQEIDIMLEQIRQQIRVDK